MTQQNWGGPPPTQGGRRSNGLWWAIIAVCAVFAIALVAWFLLRPPAPTTTTPPVATTSAVSDPPATGSSPATETDPPTPDGVDYGPFPPKNASALRDLSAGNYPATVGGTFAVENRKEYAAGIDADYKDAAAFTGFTAQVTFGTQHYSRYVGHMAAPAYVGDATCGVKDGDYKYCVMAGKAETLVTQTAQPEITLEQLGAMTQEIYAAL